MSAYPEKLKKGPDGSYSWFCSIDPDYYRSSIRPGLIACVIIAVFILLFGAVLSWKFNDWTSFLIVAGCAGVFMLISCFFFGLAFSASDPQETYEISEVYVKTGYGRSSVYLHFDKVRAVLFTRKYIELWGRNRKMRVYVPTEDSDFVKDFIHSHLPLGCDIRYESNDS